MVVGLYGKVLPNQNGALLHSHPVEMTDSRAGSRSSGSALPIACRDDVGDFRTRRYGFYANVNLVDLTAESGERNGCPRSSCADTDVQWLYNGRKPVYSLI
jgi:hypothetical protein